MRYNYDDDINSLRCFTANCKRSTLWKTGQIYQKPLVFNLKPAKGRERGHATLSPP